MITLILSFVAIELVVLFVAVKLLRHAKNKTTVSTTTNPVVDPVSSAVVVPTAIAATTQPTVHGVESFDPITNRRIKQYSTLVSVRKDGFNTSCVSNVIRGRHRTHRGLGWRRCFCQEEIHDSVRKTANVKRVRVESYNLQTKETVKTYPSILDATKDGFKQSAIHGVLKGWSTQHKGLGWRRAQTQQVTVPIPVNPLPPDTKTLTKKSHVQLPAMATGIVCYNLKNKHVVKWYPSVYAVSSNADTRRQINRVLNDNMTSYLGLGWSYYNPEKFTERQRQGTVSGTSLGTPVEGVNPTTKEVVCWFPSIRSVALSGYAETSVRWVLEGKQKLHKGLIWRYATKTQDENPAKIQSKAISDEDFVKAYISVESHMELAEKLGLEIAIVQARVIKLRKAGVPLPLYGLKKKTMPPTVTATLPVPDPEIEVALLQRKVEKEELVQIQKDILPLAGDAGWVVRVGNQTYYRSTRSEAVKLWYELRQVKV